MNLGEYSFYYNQVLGRGSFGEVYKGICNNNGAEVAVKALNLNNMDQTFWESIQNETSIMMEMNNPNIVRLYNVIRTQTHIYMIVEYCNEGDLRNLLKKKGALPERSALKIIKDVLNACYELFQRGVIHRDLKPENILLSHGIGKLADFGLAKHMGNFKNEILNSSVGTPLYMSPQILKNQKYTSKSDIWSLGVIYYELMYGRPPWTALSQWELVEKIQNQIITFSDDFHVSEPSKNFILRCLQKEEENRFSWEDVYMHPLFRSTYRYSVVKSNLEQKTYLIKQGIADFISKNNTSIEEIVQRFSANSGYLDLDRFRALVLFLLPNSKSDEISNTFSVFDIFGENRLTVSSLSKVIHTQRNLSPEKGNNGTDQKFDFNLQLQKNSSKDSIIDKITNLSLLPKSEKDNLKSFLSDKNLTEKDFFNLLPILDKNLSQTEILEIFKFFDSDSTGEITIEKFKRALDLNYDNSPKKSQRNSNPNIPPMIGGSTKSSSLEIQETPGHRKRKSRFDSSIHEPEAFLQIKNSLQSQNLQRLFKIYSKTEDKEILSKHEFFNFMNSINPEFTKSQLQLIFDYVKKDDSDFVSTDDLTAKLK